MWDQLPFSIPYDIYLRIIPTYVGSTVYRLQQLAQFPNHSHVCGINFTDSLNGGNMGESFPRMWDQLSITIILSFMSRIIPTYVGSTLNEKLEYFNSSNHSHVCGINANRESYIIACFESFPRMWDQLPIMSNVFYCKFKVFRG